MQKRVLIVANKQFEVDPLIGVFASPEAQGPTPPKIESIDWPAGPPSASEFRPRLTASLGDHQIQVWCIQDLMDPTVPGQSSNTSEKARVLAQVFSRESDQADIGLVVAFGTAATPHPQSYNGCVFVGRNVFNHDPYSQIPAKSPSTWRPAGAIDKVLVSTFPAAAFGALQPYASPLPEINARLLEPLGAPARDLLVLPRADDCAVSSVNVVDYREYPRTDPEALAAAAANGVTAVAALESTHGVIRAQSNAPFLYVSGITNRVGAFASENQAHSYTQNFVAAHNAAISLAWLLNWAISSAP